MLNRKNIAASSTNREPLMRRASTGAASLTDRWNRRDSGRCRRALQINGRVTPATTKVSRQPHGPRSARGNDITITPAPNPYARAPSPVAMAREPGGSSSTEMVSTHNRPAIARFRATNCNAPNTHHVGAAAPSTVSSAAAVNETIAIRRRPFRSARNMAAMVMTTPIRTTDSRAVCWPAEPSPRSAETNVSTWVSSP